MIHLLLYYHYYFHQAFEYIDSVVQCFHGKFQADSSFYEMSIKKWISFILSYWDITAKSAPDVYNHILKCGHLFPNDSNRRELSNYFFQEVWLIQ